MSIDFLAFLNPLLGLSLRLLLAAPALGF